MRTSLAVLVLLPVSIVSGQDLPCVNACGIPCNSDLWRNVNPALKKAIEPSIPMGIDQSAKADAGCIIHNPFGGCICHADADYGIALNSLKGLNALTVTRFSHCGLEVTNDKWVINITAQFSFSNAEISGGAYASASACGISPKASGTASAQASTPDGTIFLSIEAIPNITPTTTCIKPSAIKSVSLQLGHLSIHDT